jgi:chromosome segregation ATPase
MAPQEATRYAVALADALRKLHDQGTVVGALQPSRIEMAAGVARILPGYAPGITAYSAPEQVQGSTPDPRSDIFAFGAILHEMVSGRPAFAGATEEELRSAILEHEPAALPAEYGAFSRIIDKCLAKAALHRFQRIQRVQMELKLLMVTARRAEQEAGTMSDGVQALVRTELASMEDRLTQKFAAHEAVSSELRAKVAEQEERLQAARTVEAELRGELAGLESRLGSRLEAGDARRAELATHAAGVAQQINALVSRLEAGDAQRTELATHAAGVKNEVTVLAARVLAGDSHRAELAAYAAIVKDQIGSLVNRLDAGDAQRSELAARAAGAKDEIGALAGRLDASDEQRTELAAHGAAVKDEIALVAARVLAGDAQHAELMARVAGIRDEIGALATRLDAGDAQRADLEKRFAIVADAMATVNELADVVTGRLVAVEQKLRAQSSSIESLESAIAQTDDLVERVVEAFDSLEKSFVEQQEALTAVR